MGVCNLNRLMNWRVSIIRRATVTILIIPPIIDMVSLLFLSLVPIMALLERRDGCALGLRSCFYEATIVCPGAETHSWTLRGREEDVDEAFDAPTAY